MSYRSAVAIGPIAFDVSVATAKEIMATQPYAIGTSLWVRESVDSARTYKLRLEHSDRRLSYHVTQDGITITGDRTAEHCGGYNRQFGVFGNKGIAQQYVIHLLETNGIAVLHAAAVLYPATGYVLIAIGPSGSGKTAFVCAALEAGWHLIASELVLVSADGRIYGGNRLDNVSPGVQSELATRLPAAQLYPERRLVEPIGAKFLADFSAYADPSSEHMLRDFDVVVVAFGRELSAPSALTDREFVRRVLQQAACEKSVAAPVFDTTIFPVFEGCPSARSQAVEWILSCARQHFLLTGDMTTFRDWFSTAMAR